MANLGVLLTVAKALQTRRGSDVLDLQRCKSIAKSTNLGANEIQEQEETADANYIRKILLKRAEVVKEQFTLTTLVTSNQ